MERGQSFLHVHIVHIFNMFLNVQVAKKKPIVGVKHSPPYFVQN